MSVPVLQFLNVGFLVFHTLLIVFNCLGWAWRRTRRWNLVTLGLTAFSWLVMGLRYGVGYCICTDWHWQIRRALGYHDMEPSYLQFLVRSLTGWRPPESLTNTVAGVVFAISVLASIVLNVRDAAARRVPSYREAEQRGDS